MTRSSAEVSIQTDLTTPGEEFSSMAVYAEHYCAVVTRSEVVMYRYDTSIPYFAVRPPTERPYRAFAFTLPQSDKYALMVLDNEVILQSLSPPFLSFSYDIALDQSGTAAHMRDRELTECMRRVGGLNASNRGASLSNPNNTSSFHNGGGSSSGGSFLNPMMTASSGPTLLAHAVHHHDSSAVPSLVSTSGGNSSNSSAAASSNNNNATTSENSSTFSRLAGLVSLPTLHITPQSNHHLIPLKPKIPAPLENIPIPELPGGGGIFCDTSEPVFLSLGTDFLQRLASRGKTRLPPEKMASSSTGNNNSPSGTKNSSSAASTHSSSSNNNNNNNPQHTNIEVYLIGTKIRREWAYHTATAHAASLAARGGSVGRENFKHLFSTAIENQQSLTDIEKLLDDAVSGFIVASCAVEPPVSTSGLRVNGRWALDYGSAAKRSNNASWATPLLSEKEMRIAERATNLISNSSPTASVDDLSSVTLIPPEKQSTSNHQDPTTTTEMNDDNEESITTEQQQLADDEDELENRGRRGRLESQVPLVVAGVAQEYTTAPAAHLQLVIAEILSKHIADACCCNNNKKQQQQQQQRLDLRKLRYLRGVALEVLRCFRCLIIYPLQQAVVEAYICGSFLDTEQQEQQIAIAENGGEDTSIDLWGLLQLISFRFLAESPQLAAKLIQVGVRTRIRQLVQSGLDMLGRLGAFHELATALLQLGDLLAAVRIAVKHNLQTVAARAIQRAHAMDIEYSKEGKKCFSAASKRKLLPLILMMLRSRGDLFVNVIDVTVRGLKE